MVMSIKERENDMAVHFSKTFFEIDAKDYVNGKRVPLAKRRELRSGTFTRRRFTKKADAEKALARLPAELQVYFTISECFHVALT
jgi:inorganic pyrophosphatase/exopolyphosphatase